MGQSRDTRGTDHVARETNYSNEDMDALLINTTLLMNFHCQLNHRYKGTSVGRVSGLNVRRNKKQETT